MLKPEILNFEPLKINFSNIEISSIGIGNIGIRVSVSVFEVSVSVSEKFWPLQPWLFFILNIRLLCSFTVR